MHSSRLNLRPATTDRRACFGQNRQGRRPWSGLAARAFILEGYDRSPSAGRIKGCGDNTRIGGD